MLLQEQQFRSMEPTLFARKWSACERMIETLKEERKSA